MIGKRARAAILAVAIVGVGALTVGLTAHLRADPPTGIALVDHDAGPTGARVIQALEAEGGYEWVAADSADVEDYAAVITLPADLTASLGSLAGETPRRATVNVRAHRGADKALVEGAVDKVTHRIGAAGVDAALASATQARSQMSQVRFTAQLLNAGVNTAAAGADQFSSGADQLLGFLDFAKSGSAQLTSAVDLLRSTVSGATAQANELAAALDSTGITVAQVEGTAHTIGNGLDQILPTLRALPFAGDPAVADVIGKLEALRGISGQASTQLTGLSALVGASTDPNTDLGTLLHTVVDRLDDASAQLTRGAELAQDLPRLADEGGAQLLDAIGQLTGGVDQLRSVVGNLNTQADKAVAALPPRGAAEQSALALALTDPVEVGWE
ncbi:YhgE/Pip domain-containing protein [Nocardia callitridis]|uniref:hypothetical protein n=1 Tax=Nocardia callitridis TaxID=648753 RepID=UPI0031EFF06A